MSEHLSECSEATEIGLEGPPGSSSPSATVVDEYKKQGGQCCEAVLLRKLEFV